MMKKKIIISILILVSIFLLISIALKYTNKSNENNYNEVIDKVLEGKGVYKSSLLHLGRYENIKVKKHDINITKDDVAQRVEEKLDAFSEWKVVKEHSQVQEGDSVFLQFDEYENNKLLHEKSEMYATIGSDNLDKEIQKTLVGMNVSDSFDVTYKKEGTGTLIRYKGIIVNLVERKIPILTDEFVKNSYGVKDVSDFYQMVRVELETERNNNEKNRVLKTIYKKIFSKSKFSIDTEEILKIAKVKVEEYENVAYSCGKDVVDFMRITLNKPNMTEEEFYSMCYDEAEYDIQCYLVVGAIANKESIDISGEYKRTLKEKNYTEDSMKGNPTLEYGIKYHLLNNEISDILLDRLCN